MKLLTAFLKLVRWPNLFFITLTQVLFHYAVIVPSANGRYFNFPLHVNETLFWLLCISSVCIAAAGYIINDYFDINIDNINKPNKNVVDRVISRRWALFWHLLLSAAGVAIGIYLGWKLHNPVIPVAHFICVLLLWFYSTTFKRKLIIGNVVISALTAWVILVQLVAELPGWINGSIDSTVEKLTIARLGRIGILYASFAFIISIVREVIKDMEDIEGDRRNGCKTLPIVMGVNAAKMFAAVWLVVLLATLIVTQFYVIQFGWWISSAYLVVMVVVPLIMLFSRLLKAATTEDYAKLSTQVKIIMFTGMLSMIFFIYYTK